VGALLRGTLVGGFRAVTIDLVAVQPILRRDSNSQSWLITTLAISLALQDLMGKIWGGDARPFRYPSPFSARYVVRSGTAGLSNYSFVLIAAPFVILAGLWLLYRTRIGRAVRAVAEDRQGAVLRGIDPIVLTRLSWFLGGAIASFAGVLAAPLLFASITLGPTLLIAGFMAVAIGGVGHNTGALIGGYLVALVEGLAALRISSDLTSVATFVVLLIVLLVRPHGVFAEQEARRV
jgi:branched-chain amino acid transport system permease protein